jgi:hypothetical protein
METVLKYSPLASAICALFMLIWNIWPAIRARITGASGSEAVEVQKLPWWRRPIPVMVLLVIFAWLPSFIGLFQASSPPTAPSPSPMAPPPPSSQERPLGSTFSIQLAQTLESLPKPCLIKLTGPHNTELFRTIDWVIAYGHGDMQPICSRVEDNPIPNADEQLPKRAPDGELIVHWNQLNKQVEKLALFFIGVGLKTSSSHILPPRSPDNLVWIDIGPGSPWK